MATYELYQRELHSHLGSLAVWLPGDRIELGDIGTLTDGRFHKESSLKELGIDQVNGKAGPPRTVSYQAATKTTVSGTAGAAAHGVGRAALSVAFTAKGGYLFHATGLREQRLEERQALSADVLRARESGLWRDNKWVLVEAIYVADGATVLVSEDDSASLELEGGASTLAAPTLHLAEAGAGLSVRSQSGRIAQILAARRVPLLYSCVRIKTSLFGKARLARGGDLPAEPSKREAADNPFIDIDVEELLSS